MDPTHFLELFFFFFLSFFFFLELLCASTGLAAGDATENKDTNHCPYPTDIFVEGQAENKTN